MSPAVFPWLLAHQGGWDELLMFGIPVVLAVFAVRWADRRAKARNADLDAAGDQVPPDLESGATLHEGPEQPPTPGP